MNKSGKKNYKKKTNICKYDAVQCKNSRLFCTGCFSLLLSFFANMFVTSLYCCSLSLSLSSSSVSLCLNMCLCTVFGCRSFFALVRWIQMEKLQENDTFYLNAMVNGCVYVFYTVVYMCKLVVFTIFGTTLVLLSFTFLTCFRLPVVYHFFTCRS